MRELRKFGNCLLINIKFETQIYICLIPQAQLLTLTYTRQMNIKTI